MINFSDISQLLTIYNFQTPFDTTLRGLYVAYQGCQVYVTGNDCQHTDTSDWAQLWLTEQLSFI